MKKADLIIYNSGQLLTCASEGKAKKGKEMQNLGIIENGAIAVKGNIISAVGKSVEILAEYESDNVLNANGKVVMPAFVDPHTHIVFAGNRLNEFELKIKGADYLEILANGGGILSTVKQTREADLEDLVEQSRKRLDKMLAHGTATVEIKTGYGLNTETELKMLGAILKLNKTHPIDLVPTLLAAHAVPLEFKDNPDEYVGIICQETIPFAFKLYYENMLDIESLRERIRNNIEEGTGIGAFSFSPETIANKYNANPFFIDVFCEKNAFNLVQTQKVLEAGKRFGMKIKAHVDEFTNLGGSKLCIEMGAVSIDHLDAISGEEMKLLAESETVGIVTPTVNFNFGSSHFADARKLIDSGCAVAISTDYNPGSAPCPSQQTAMQIACRYQKLLPSEAINGTTINAAFSIALGNKTGSLEVGKSADILLMDTDDYREVCYEFGGNFVKSVIKDGKKLI